MPLKSIVGELLPQRTAGQSHTAGEPARVHQPGGLSGVSPARHARRRTAAGDEVVTLPTGETVVEDETLTYLHNCVSDRWHPVRLPALPIDIDIMLCDRPWHGGWYPYFGTPPLVPGAPDDRTHVRVCSIQATRRRVWPTPCRPSTTCAFPTAGRRAGSPWSGRRKSIYWPATQRQWYGQRKTMRDVLMEKASRQETADPQHHGGELRHGRR